MLILIPDKVYDELSPLACAIDPTIETIRYGEDERDGHIARISEADAILRWVGNRFSSLIEQAPRMRWLHTDSAGVDHVLTPAVRAQKGLVVTDSGPAFEIAISEFVLAWMLAAARHLSQFQEHQRAHRWQGETQAELHGATVGVIGTGPIGRGVASRCKAFGIQTLGYRRSALPAEGFDETLTGADGLNRLLAESDYLVIAAALTDNTSALIGESQLARMKPNAWLINIARGRIVDEIALIDALQRGTIAGACLDVFEREPLPQDSPLWDMPNVLIAPHNSSGNTRALALRQQAIFLDNVKRFVAGEPLENVVDIERGY